jgi:glycosyltransferase involved in cell wall biosynthesis
MNESGSRPLRVTFVIFSLGAGGAERVISIMASYWAARDWPVTLLTIVDGREPPFYSLHPAVRVRHLGVAAESSNPLKRVVGAVQRIVALRPALVRDRPDLVVSFMDRTNILTLLASRRLNVPVVVAERCDPRHNPIGHAGSFARRLLYRHASRVVVQTDQARGYFPPAIRRRTAVIPNPVLDGCPCAPPLGRASGARRLIAMGRLTEQKGFDLLIRAFALLATRHSQWSLTIWGEGPCRAELEALRDELGLRASVCLPGRTKDPRQRMCEADLFVLSSRYEGFPNVLCEAMAAGLAVVSFDCPSGPADIVRDGVDGLLVPPGDIAALASALDRLMTDDQERQRLADRATEVVARFGLDRVMGMWQEVFACVAQ